MQYKLRSVSVSVADEDNVEFRSNVLNSHAIKELHRKFIMTGDNKYLKMWEVCIMVLVIWQALYVPTILSFEPVIGRSMWTFDRVVDIWFIFDFFTQFNTARKNKEGILPKTRYEVAKAYIKSGTPKGAWFLIDLSASFPYDWATQDITEVFSYDFYVNELKNTVNKGDLSGSVRIVKILRLPRLLRILKIFRLLSGFKSFEKYQQTLKYSRYGHLLRLFKNLFYIVLLCHYGACAWYGIAGPRVGDHGWFQYECVSIFQRCDDDLRYNTTTEQMMCYERCNYSAMSQYELGNHFPTLYVTSYFAIIAMMTAGENLSPITISEKIGSIIFILGGSILMAIMFGEVAVLISNFYARQSKYQTKMEYLFESMKRMGLPPEIEKRVYSYYNYIHDTHGTLNGETTAFIPELSKKLAAEVLMYLRMDMIHKVPFFQNISPEVVQQLVLKLTLQVFLPKEYICVRGEVGDEMFFISDGDCEVTIPFKDMPQEKKDELMRNKLKNTLLKQQNTRKHSNFLNTIARRKSGAGVFSENEDSSKRAIPSERSFISKAIEKSSTSAKSAREKMASARMASSTRNMSRNEQDPTLANTDEHGNGRSSGSISSNAIASAQSSKSIQEVRKQSFVQLFKNRNRKSNVGEEDEGPSIDPEKEMVLATLKKGAHFGEIALILLTKRTANVRAKGFCELCGLNRDTYNKIVAVYIEDKKAMEDYILTKYGKHENVQETFEAEQQKQRDAGFNMEEEAEDEGDVTPAATPKKPTTRQIQKGSSSSNMRVMNELKEQASAVERNVDKGVREMNERLEKMTKLQSSNRERMDDMHGMMEMLRKLEDDITLRRKEEKAEKIAAEEEKVAEEDGEIEDEPQLPGQANSDDGGE